MGLDITAYRKLTPAPHAATDSDGSPVEWQKYAHIHQSSLEFTEENWPGRSAGTSAGVFAFADKLGFRAGSYGGYNWWRDKLAQMAHGKSARELWEDEAAGPFAELIHFADNEGVIGPEVSAKLARDFAEHQQKAEEFAKAMPEEGHYWLTKYSEWRKAFEMASDGGAVDFH